MSILQHAISNKFVFYKGKMYSISNMSNAIATIKSTDGKTIIRNDQVIKVPRTTKVHIDDDGVFGFLSILDLLNCEIGV